jgi:hypothetical protein
VKPGDEVIELRDLLLPLLVVRFDARANLRLGEHHVVVAAVVGNDGLVVDIGRVRADSVEEMPVVRDHDEGAFVSDEKLPHPMNRLQVEMVRRLVEQQRLGMPEQGLRQQHAHLLSPLQLPHRSLVQLVSDVETLEQNRGVAFRCVAVLVSDDAFELAEPHAVLVGHGRLRVQLLAFLEGAPQAGVAHDDGIDDAESIEGKVILAEHTELRRCRDRSLLGRQFARQQLHERGFAGAVRPRQSVAAPGRKRGRHVVEEHFRPEPHRYVLN